MQEGLVQKPPKRKKPDLGTDRAEAYNKANNTNIVNNAMLDRYLRNKAEMEKLKK